MSGCLAIARPRQKHCGGRSRCGRATAGSEMSAATVGFRYYRRRKAAAAVAADRSVVAGSDRHRRAGGCRRRSAARWAACRVFGRRRGRFRYEFLEHAGQNLPFATPVVVAHQRPCAFDDIRLGRRGIQKRRVATALAPHRRLAVGRPRTPAVVVFAVDAFFHVIVSPCHDNFLGDRRLLAGSARNRVTYLFCRKFATVVASTCSDQRSNLKAD